MLFIERLLEATSEEGISNEDMQYLNDEDTPLTNLVSIASDEVVAMNKKVKCFASGIKC